MRGDATVTGGDADTRRGFLLASRTAHITEHPPLSRPRLYPAIAAQQQWAASCWGSPQPISLVSR